MYEPHGMSNTPINRVWRDLKTRCINPNNKQYKDYGGRGISVCEEWKNSFLTFYKDMGDVPFKGAQIDRKNTDGNYCKENCRWATRSLNMANKKTRSTNMPRGVQLNGKTSKRYKATIQIEKINYKLGVYDTIEEASAAHNLMYKEWYGQTSNM